MVHHAPDGRILRANARYCALLGYTQEELLGRPVKDFLHADDCGSAAGAIHLDDAPDPLPPCEQRYVRKDGTIVWLRLQLSVARDAASIPLYAIGVVEDVTEQRRLLERKVTEWEHELAGTIEAMPDGVLLYGPTGEIRHANTAYRILLALNDDELRRPLSVRARTIMVREPTTGGPLPEELWPATRLLRGEVLTGADSMDVLVRARDGRDVLVNCAGAPIYGEADRLEGAVMVIRDVGERRQLERRTQEALEALLAMAQALVAPVTVAASEATSETADRTTADIAQRLVELTCRVLGCRRVAILAVDPETRLQRPVAAEGLTPEQEHYWHVDQAQSTARYGDDWDPDVLARFEAGGAFIVDMTQPPYNQHPNPYGITTVLTAPMRVGGKVLGLLSLDYAGERHHFTANEMALARAVGQLAALVIERERLVQEREESRASELALLTINQRMDDFLSMATHDLKSPVAGAKSVAQLATRRLRRLATQQGGDLGAASIPFREVEGPLDMVTHSMDRLTRLVDRLLDVSRVRTGKLEVYRAPCDLALIVRECVAEQRALAPHRTIELDPSGAEPVPLQADAERIGQVVTNYLTNALRYSPADQSVHVAVRAEGSQARVSIRDHGHGIPAPEQATIWSRFEQASSVKRRTGSGSGLGLGLYISREIVERHGGQVGVDSVVGRGSTFWFTLPLIAPQPDA
jgi:PAS domain S-box-containing protein